jgi:hypothetical protein
MNMGIMHMPMEGMVVHFCDRMVFFLWLLFDQMCMVIDMSLEYIWNLD